MKTNELAPDAALVGVAGFEASNAAGEALTLSRMPVHQIAWRPFGMTSFGAGAVSGLSMSLVADEFSGPMSLCAVAAQGPAGQASAWSLGRLVDGVSVAGPDEAGWKLTGRR